jgi:hypothetical protein
MIGARKAIGRSVRCWPARSIANRSRSPSAPAGFVSSACLCRARFACASEGAAQMLSTQFAIAEEIKLSFQTILMKLELAPANESRTAF